MTSSDLRELALKLGAMETISTKPNLPARTKPAQQFDYLIVLDFEATCWNTKMTRKTANEIIEFAAVLLHIPSGEIISTFKKYVKPTENPILTDFCTSLTGIKQSTVNNASTIEPVLEEFDSWVQENSKLHNFDFVSTQYKKNDSLCTFATWSDWDLGTCLKKECKRKRLYKESYFNQWIDVRQTYMEFYKDTPMGLIGALHSLKMNFVGQEHCGIDDARNTAYLINRMVQHGLHLANTKSI
ncbi:ERI1 exoribonuclease 2-like [Atheta coriaria]|uniref:ERI1 exoribonuclease 2-like n=1 Tax=Dalotia coriaria TaxID=877792 RepID=UPI0031F43E1A